VGGKNESFFLTTLSNGNSHRTRAVKVAISAEFIMKAATSPLLFLRLTFLNCQSRCQHRWNGSRLVKTRKDRSQNRISPTERRSQARHPQNPLEKNESDERNQLEEDRRVDAGSERRRSQGKITVCVLVERY
jgi:hypothetical protein